MSLTARCTLAGIPLFGMLLCAAFVLSLFAESLSRERTAVAEALLAERALSTAAVALQSAQTVIVSGATAPAVEIEAARRKVAEAGRQMGALAERSQREGSQTPSAYAPVVAELDLASTILRGMAAAQAVSGVSAQRVEDGGVGASTPLAAAMSATDDALGGMRASTETLADGLPLFSLGILGAFCLAALVLRESVIVPVGLTRQRLLRLSEGGAEWRGQDLRRDELGDCVRAAEALCVQLGEAELARHRTLVGAALLEARTVSRDKVVASLRKQTLEALARLSAGVTDISASVRDGLTAATESIAEEAKIATQATLGARADRLALEARELGRTGRALVRTIEEDGSAADGNKVDIPLAAIEALGSKARYLAFNARIETAREVPSRDAFLALMKEIDGFCAQVGVIETSARRADETQREEWKLRAASLAQLRRETTTLARLAERVAQVALPPAERTNAGTDPAKGVPLVSRAPPVNGEARQDSGDQAPVVTAFAARKRNELKGVATEVA